jgi:uncharacterized membrane protein
LFLFFPKNIEFTFHRDIFINVRISKKLGFKMNTKRGAGLVSLFVLVLLIFSLSSKVQAQGTVSVSIDPQERHAKVGTECTFKITINNPEGRGTDNFSLEASDNLGWVLTFENNLLEVQENGHKTTTLTIAIPENIELYTQDNILVTATSQREPTLTRNVGCRVVAVSLGVELFISPPENIQPPGEIATFEITVQNIGLVIDNYRLKATESASTGQSWKPTFGENFFEDVAPGENRTTTLTVTIPRDAEQGDWSTVGVTVTSQTDSNVYDFSSCIAKTPMETNWNYFYTGIGIVVAAGIIIVVLWKGPLAGG